MYRTCYAYDGLGRKISETSPNADLAACPAGPPATALPFTSSTRYDADGRVTGTISPSPADVNANPFLAVRNGYDPAGRLTKVETGTLATWQSESVAPSAWSGFTVLRTVETRYDVMGRKVREWVREGASGPVRTMTETSYDLAGRVTCTATRMNPAAFAFTGLPNACAANAPGADGPDRIARTIYDAAGQVLQQRIGAGAEEGAEATFAYNLAGQRTTVIDGNGNRAELRYDGHGRQDRWTFPSTTRPASYNDATQTTALATAGAVNANDYEQYGFDPAGNRTSLRKRDGSILGYQYDALNRMTVKIVPERLGLAATHTRDVYYGYDLRGLQTFARFDSAGGQGITNIYDGFGRLASHSINLNGVTRTLSYAWDRDGHRTRIAHPDGIAFRTFYTGLGQAYYLDADGPPIAHTYFYPDGSPMILDRPTLAPTYFNYDGIQRLSRIVHTYAGWVGNADWTWTRNAAGQIASIGRDNDAYAWTSHYAVNRPYTTNGLNQYSGAGSTSFTYDANGNLYTDGSRTFYYDIENRLVHASAGTEPTLNYDPLGRLHGVSSTTATTTFLYDGDALVAEYDGAGTLQRRYAHAVGTDVPLIEYTGSGLSNARWLHADHQGSIVALSTSGGATAAINRYDEYGIPAATNTGRFQFTGQIWLPDLGMYHYKARLYSPTLGRFLQTDPIGYDDQVNLYAYVGNDPVNGTDSTGLARVCPPNDENCIETPESERQPGDPPPPSSEEEEMEGIVVEAPRTTQVDFSHENEEFFTVSDGQLIPRPMDRQRLNCGSYLEPEYVYVGQPGPIPSGQMAAHSHGDSLNQFPDRRDDAAARASRGGVAGLFTRDRSFTIRQFPNGTFRVRQHSGSAMSSEERSSLREFMQGWERPPPSGSARTGGTLRSRICR